MLVVCARKDRLSLGKRKWRETIRSVHIAAGQLPDWIRLSDIRVMISFNKIDRLQSFLTNHWTLNRDDQLRLKSMKILKTNISYKKISH